MPKASWSSTSTVPGACEFRGGAYGRIRGGASRWTWSRESKNANIINWMDGKGLESDNRLRLGICRMQTLLRRSYRHSAILPKRVPEWI